VNIDHTRFCIPRDTYLDRLATMVDCWFFTREAKDMAHEALNKAKSESGL
jgi:hypothetical protein